MRRKIIAGNWKMNKTIPEAIKLSKEVVALSEGADCEVVICPTFVCLAPVHEAIQGSHVALGAQDVHWEEKGAYTGKVSGEMLKSAGVKYVIIGHSEQRTYFHETNATVNKKVKAVLKAGLLPIICVGETLEQREAGRTEEVCQDHIRGAYEGLSKEDALRTVVAYEPVWAIGTGRTATPQQAQEVHAFIRNLLKSMYDQETADQIRIQYGGSMKADNAKELLSQADIDGGLIGGASLKADDFRGIIFAR
jgi:triosephosphate isomerase (TIM)